MTPITIGFPSFTATRVKETPPSAAPPSAAPAGTATPVNTTAAPPAITALHMVFPIFEPALSLQPGPSA
ncbi:MULTISPECIES: hypothetical protein [unclassified Streptomyces]|uniref:hypothetical protein n=1 Tax=unclassified Streptomyces TaxID=2593676 RepID=UPI001F529B58|nr:hypothetical protein [Streptomyces sp. TSRI0281]